MKPARILMVEDNEGDVLMAGRAMQRSAPYLDLVSVDDGVDAMNYLHRRDRYATAARPDLILLDLNLPRMDGRKVLAALKSDPDLRTIPVVIFSSSEASADRLRTYEDHANCYVVKPDGAKEFEQAIERIMAFWFTLVAMPPT